MFPWRCYWRCFWRWVEATLFACGRAVVPFTALAEMDLRVDMLEAPLPRLLQLGPYKVDVRGRRGPNYPGWYIGQ